MYVLILAAIIVAFILTFIKKHKENYPGMRFGEACDGVASFDIPKGSISLIVKGYNYDTPPRIYEDISYRRVYPLQYTQDYSAMIYYYVIPYIDNILIETDVDVQPIVELKDQETILSVKKIFKDYSGKVVWKIGE